MDLDLFLKKFNEEIKYASYEDGYELTFPFKLYNDDHISSCFIKEDETGAFIISDNRNVFDYFENHGISIESYQRQIKQICKMFGLFIEDGCVKKILGEYETNQTFVQLSNFFIGISHLVTIKYFI